MIELKKKNIVEKRPVRYPEEFEVLSSQKIDCRGYYQIRYMIVHARSHRMDACLHRKA